MSVRIRCNRFSFSGRTRNQRRNRIPRNSNEAKIGPSFLLLARDRAKVEKCGKRHAIARDTRVNGKAIEGADNE